MGVFQVFKIAQMVPNHAKHHMRRKICCSSRWNPFYTDQLLLLKLIVDDIEEVLIILYKVANINKTHVWAIIFTKLILKLFTHFENISALYWLVDKEKDNFEKILRYFENLHRRPTN